MLPKALEQVHPQRHSLREQRSRSDAFKNAGRTVREASGMGPICTDLGSAFFSLTCVKAT